MAGNFDKFRVKKPDLNKSSATVAPAAAEVEIADAEVVDDGEPPETAARVRESEPLARPQTERASTKKLTAESSFGDSPASANSRKKSMQQTGYRIREEYIEALRLRAKREERKIESVLDEILSNYFDSDEKGQKYLQTATQILQIKLDY